MLVKQLEIRRVYPNGFDDNSQKIVSIYDLDREISILSGDEVVERILTTFNGIVIGLEMAGYSVNVERVVEVDGLNGNTRISQLKV